jgi:hypothetical protein
VQVHSSDIPQLWNMTKCLVVSLFTGAVGVLGSVLFLWLSLPNHVNWFGLFGAPLDVDNPIKPHTTNGQVLLPSSWL